MLAGLGCGSMKNISSLAMIFPIWNKYAYYYLEYVQINNNIKGVDH